MIDPIFRSRLPSFTGPVITIYRKCGLTPNQVTVAGFVLGCVAAFFVAGHWSFLAISLWWMGRLLDGTDGILARELGTASPFGAFLDILLDMAAYSAMIIGFDIAAPEQHQLWMVVLALYVLCITGALALGNLEIQFPGASKLESDNRGLRLAAGVAEGGETGIAYTLFLLFPSALGVLAEIWIIILSITVIARLILARRELKASQA